jgi:hypothetical protein
MMNAEAKIDYLALIIASLVFSFTKDVFSLAKYVLSRAREVLFPAKDVNYLAGKSRSPSR